MSRLSSFDEFEEVRRRATEKHWSGPPSIRVGMASCGLAAGAEKLYEAASEGAAAGDGDLAVVRVGCRGSCVVEPMVEVVCPDFHLIFSDVTLAGMNDIMEGARTGDFTALEGLGTLWQERQSLRTDGTPFVTRPGYEGDAVDISSVPFYLPQQKIVTRNCGLIDPFSIEDAFARDGYAALVKVLEDNDPEAVIQTILDSGLRGRGGAGFPTGRKWAIARAAPGENKAVFVNADEGDPGAFMDRSVLESDPHAVLEGMIIGAFAVGASTGIVYIRAEYPLAVQTVQNAIVQAREYGLLGDNILGTSFSFDVSIRIGAGAFVCGEETALIASAEGKVGEPRPRPPYPAQQGYHGNPTVINNVKTWSSVAPIILNGADWFAGIGSEHSKGTAVFCVTGNIRNTGLAEVPMGTTLSDIVFEVGGGPEKAGRKIKAVQTGGPSGGCLPSSLFDLPVDYERLTEAGAMMGSGGMIVVDDRTCMVNLAKFFLEFTMDESCGKCTPCREGTRRMYGLLDKMTSGKGTEEDIAFLEELATYVKDSSLCGLGATAPNPVLSTLRYFRDEYEAHIRDKKCPAGSCAALISFHVEPEKCTACGACSMVCPVGAVPAVDGAPPVIDQNTCTRCRTCYEVCPVEAIRIE
jgi:NADH:ubiquinone oxidoreductase subunit F (NADH-binding)